jgi:hypothetical protein
LRRLLWTAAAAAGRQAGQRSPPVVTAAAALRIGADATATGSSSLCPAQPIERLQAAIAMMLVALLRADGPCRPHSWSCKAGHSSEAINDVPTLQLQAPFGCSCRCCCRCCCRGVSSSQAPASAIVAWQREVPAVCICGYVMAPRWVCWPLLPAPPAELPPGVGAPAAVAGLFLWEARQQESCPPPRQAQAWVCAPALVAPAAALQARAAAVAAAAGAWHMHSGAAPGAVLAHRTCCCSS